MGGVVIIPARGGSKRVPRKNLLRIGGRPMLAWPISAAQSISEVDRIIVSTDDDEIAQLANQLGADASRRRPGFLAQDETPTAPVIVHEVNQYTQRISVPDFVIVLYPTSIFTETSDLSAMLTRLRRSDNPVQMVLSATVYPAPIERAWRLTDLDVGSPINPETRNIQSPTYESHFYDNGQAYVSGIEAWSMIEAGQPVTTALHVLPPSRAWDINTFDDLAIAEILFQQSHKSLD